MAKISVPKLRESEKCEAFLDALGIKHHGGLRWDPRLEGYRDFTFGCRAGPGKPSVMDLCHELAHAVQFGPGQFKKRALARGFRFNVPSVWIGNTHCVEAATAQATDRELETFAYQAHLIEAAGFTFSRTALFRYASKLLVRFMHDWYNLPGETQEERQRWCVKRAEHFYQKRSQAQVMARLTGWLDKTEARLRATG